MKREERRNEKEKKYILIYIKEYERKVKLAII